MNADEFSQQVMTLVNKERTSRGLNALVLGGANLNAATELRARELAEVNSHTRPDGTSCFTVLNTFNVKDQAVGEVAAWGQPQPGRGRQFLDEFRWPPCHPPRSGSPQDVRFLLL